MGFQRHFHQFDDIHPLVTFLPLPVMLLFPFVPNVVHVYFHFILKD